MSQLDSTSLDSVKKRFNPEHDECKDRVEDRRSYTLQGNVFKYAHGRPLPNETAEKAIRYIRSITKGYPFQLRYVLALPLWTRFSEAWCDTGDESKSLRAI